jgi:L-ascorbate metabolism protein UlaG (beta-lactamase superfamily)
MRTQTGLFLFFLVVCFSVVSSTLAFEQDTVQTDRGPLVLTFIGHGSLAVSFQGKSIQIDPWSRLAEYTKFPKADLVLITHEHGDHLDTTAVQSLRAKSTVILCPEVCAQKLDGATIIRNGESRVVAGIPVEAVPAYNIVHLRDDSTPFHPRGRGNGYVLTCGSTRVYIAGDTENTPEMKALKDIDIAFLPMNLPYTMTPEMVADAVKTFRPRILYPYHFGTTDTARLLDLLHGVEGVEVRMRSMK